MSRSDVRDFAQTSHAGLPEKKAETNPFRMVKLSLDATFRTVQRALRSAEQRRRQLLEAKIEELYRANQDLQKNMTAQVQQAQQQVQDMSGQMAGINRPMAQPNYGLPQMNQEETA